MQVHETWVFSSGWVLWNDWKWSRMLALATVSPHFGRSDGSQFRGLGNSLASADIWQTAAEQGHRFDGIRRYFERLQRSEPHFRRNCRKETRLYLACP